MEKKHLLSYLSVSDPGIIRILSNVGMILNTVKLYGYKKSWSFFISLALIAVILLSMIVSSKIWSIKWLNDIEWAGIRKKKTENSKEEKIRNGDRVCVCVCQKYVSNKLRTLSIELEFGNKKLFFFCIYKIYICTNTSWLLGALDHSNTRIMEISTHHCLIQDVINFEWWYLYIKVWSFYSTMKKWFQWAMQPIHINVINKFNCSFRMYVHIVKRNSCNRCLERIKEVSHQWCLFFFWFVWMCLAELRAMWWCDGDGLVLEFLILNRRAQRWASPSSMQALPRMVRVRYRLRANLTFSVFFLCAFLSRVYSHNSNQLGWWMMVCMCQVLLPLFWHSIHSEGHFIFIHIHNMQRQPIYRKKCGGAGATYEKKKKQKLHVSLCGDFKLCADDVVAAAIQVSFYFAYRYSV